MYIDVVNIFEINKHLRVVTYLFVYFFNHTRAPEYIQCAVDYIHSAALVQNYRIKVKVLKIKKINKMKLTFTFDYDLCIIVIINIRLSTYTWIILDPHSNSSPIMSLYHRIGGDNSWGIKLLHQTLNIQAVISCHLVS